MEIVQINFFFQNNIYRKGALNMLSLTMMILPVIYLAVIVAIFFFAFRFLKAFESIAKSLDKLAEKK